MQDDQSDAEIKQRVFGFGVTMADDASNMRRVGKSPQEVRDLIRDAAAKALGYAGFEAIPSGAAVWLTENVDTANLFKPRIDDL
jgi:hypothetical protein